MSRNLKYVVLLVLLWVGFAQAKKAPEGPKKMTNEECLACHNDPLLTKEVDGKQVSVHVKEDAFKGSIHSVFGCVDCHTDVKEYPHSPTPAKPACATCHIDQQKAYEHGFHAKAIEHGDTKAARCVDCHGSPHEIVPSSDPKSRVHRTNIPTTCGSCHGQKFVMESSGLTDKPFASYEESVHGKAVAAGSDKAAVCTDCHGGHDIRSASDPESPIYKSNVPNTCAKCHDAQKQAFMGSIHGQAITRGNLHAPVCTDCHGIHLIKRHIDPTSSVAAQNLARTTCAQCHESVKMSEEFGVPGRRATTYLASYHGLATKMGSNVAANCASCHGVHNILPSDDPRSTISKANLVQTCGKCHPGANDNFIKGKVHIDAPLKADVGSVAVNYVRKFYLWMIVMTIGGMLLHNLIILQRKLALSRTGAGHHAGSARIIVRMNRVQRIQHATLFISFFTLVLTGFALKYSDSWLAHMMGGETVRGIIHRIAGVVLILVGVYHTYYLIATRDGRKLFLDFLPDIKDALDVKDVILYHLGLSHKKPEFRRFTYAEKAEYLALVWGTIVMAVSGIMMWAKVYTGNIVPRWFIDVATAVHFYEAILATLAIIVWHFYQIIFDPDVYPMNWAWFDGKVSVEHYLAEHSLDTETLRNVEAEDVVEAEAETQEQAAPSDAEPEAVGSKKE